MPAEVLMLLSPGTELGPYEVIAPIASGGMGEVYRARDRRLAREVAIKILTDDVAHHAELEARFKEEARLLASVNHANIVAIYDLGTVNDVSYVVFELVEGDTLRRRLGSGALSPAVAVEYARQIAEGMAAAHERGIVHRDLKPENLVVTPKGLVKILDFGIAKGRGSPVEDGDAAKTRVAMTKPGVILGTVGYMAPEQLRGLAADSRSDLFSFGVILYEMLTGVRAFPGRTEIDVLSAILTQDVANPATTNPAVSQTLGLIVLRCLERNPSARYQTARDLLQALSDLDRDGRMPAAVAARPSVDARPSIAVLPFADMSAEKDQEYLCDGIAEEIMSALAHAPGLRVVARSSAFQFKGAARDIRQIGAALGATFILEGSVRKAAQRIRIAAQLANAEQGHQIWSERFDRDLGDVLAMQDEIAQRVADALEIRLSQSTTKVSQIQKGDLEAYTEYLKARHYFNRRTEADLELSVSHFRKALERDPSYARAHAGLADVLAMLAVYGAKAPAEVIPKARGAAERALQLDPDLAGAHACLGLILSLHDWSWSSAAREFRRAIAINNDDATAHQALAINYLVPLGQFDDALEELRLAMALDPLSLAVSATVGVTLFYAGRFDQAEQALLDTIRLDDRFPLAHMFLGQVRTAQHRYREALDSLETAVRLAGRTPEMLAAYGHALAGAGDREQATRILAEVQALSEKRFAAPTTFAELHVGLGNYEAALDALESAARMRTLDFAWTPIRPYFAPLRREPRFEALVKSIGATEARQSEAPTVRGPSLPR